MDARCALVVILGCQAPERADPDPGATEPSPPASSPAPSPTSPTSSTPTPPAEPFDCAAIPRDPISVTEVPGARAYEDVLFDPNGYLIGGFHDDLVRVNSAGEFSVYAPGVGGLRGMDWLQDGDIVAGGWDLGGLVRVSPGGVSSPLASQSGYGVVVAPDGAVYVAGSYAIYRVDPATGEVETLVESPDVTPQAIDFSPDFRRLYMGPTNGGGDIYFLELGPDYRPISGLQIYATDVGRGYVDGIGTDICGNVYVSDYNKRSLYRIWTTGEVQLLVDEGEQFFGHGMEWGNGIGGWSETALFQPQPYNGDTVVQIELGVPGRRYSGPVVHADDGG